MNHSAILTTLYALGFPKTGITSPTIRMGAKGPRISGGNLKLTKKVGSKSISVVLGKTSITVRSPGITGGRETQSFKYDNQANLQQHLLMKLAILRA